MIRSGLVAGFTIATLMSGVAAAQELSVAGTWYTPSEKSAITIEDCGDGSPCGFVSFTNPDPGDPLVNDINNPDPDLQGRPVLGMPLMWSFSPMSRRDGWKRGKIYDPTSGRVYGSSIEVTDDDQLKVKGCFGPFCQTQYWNRVPADLVLASSHTDLSTLNE